MEDTSAQTRMLKAIWSNGVLRCHSCLARNTEQTWYNITFRDEDSFCLLHLCNVNFNLDHSYWSQLTSIGQSGDSTIQILIQFIFYFELFWTLKGQLKKNKLNWWLEDHATDCCKSSGSTPSTMIHQHQNSLRNGLFFFFLLRIVCVADQHRQPDGHKHTGSWLSEPTIDTKAERRSFALPGSRHICRNYSPNYPYKRWD